MFYEQVKGLCDDRHIAISTLARKLNLSPSAPANWKAGTLPKAETLIKISEYFGVSVDFLLFGSERGNQNTATAQNGAAVLQNSGGNTVSINTGEGASNIDLQGFEQELVRIYRRLNMLGKSELIHKAYSLEAVIDNDEKELFDKV